MVAMETDTRRPNAALINREWFESASGIMSQEDLAMVVLNACRYVFGLPAVAMKNQSQNIVFAMVKPALDSDLAKYAERCARNAANAKSPHRVSWGEDTHRNIPLAGNP